MKGGNVYKARGKHSAFILLAVICMTIFLWSYERKPFTTTLFSSQDQLILPTSDVIQLASHISEEPVKPEDLPFQESPNIPEETENRTEARVSTAEGTEDKSKAHITSDEPEEKAEPYTSGVLNTVPTVEEAPGTREDGVNLVSSERKACDYAKGRWVVDNSRPLYSGFKCKQWLSEMWACRLTQRPDFGYEAYKWQPKDCDMPDFEQSEFLRRMQDKTIAFVGDSLGRQQFQSLMCMVTGTEESNIQDVGREYGLTTPHGASRPNGCAFRFPETNTTMLYYWSSCLCDLVPLNPRDPQSQVAMHLDSPPSFLNHFLHHFDVLILNTGHHWNRGKVNANRWVMFIDGKPNEYRRLAMICNAKNITIHSIAKWVDSQLPYHPRLKAFFKSISPRHFFNGE